MLNRGKNPISIISRHANTLLYVMVSRNSIFETRTLKSAAEKFAIHSFLKYSKIRKERKKESKERKKERKERKKGKKERKKKERNSLARANYIDRATAVSRRS
jgi:hypothetical protein